MKIGVVGIGQNMRGDDAAGPAAVRMWQHLRVEAAGGSEIKVRIVEQPGLDLLEALEGVEAAVLVDAIQSGGEPGSVRQLAIEDLDSAETRKGGMHSWGVAETLALGRLLDQLQGNLTVRVVGIEAERVEFGAALSETVRRSLPDASALIQAQVETFLGA